MKASIKVLNLSMEIKNRRIELDVSGSAGKILVTYWYQNPS